MNRGVKGEGEEGRRRRWRGKRRRWCRQRRRCSLKYIVYIMTRIVLLTGEDIIEGFIGLISLIITAYILSHIIHAPRSVILGMSFIITWYFRRIGVNVYKYLKSNNIFSIKPLHKMTIG